MEKEKKQEYLDVKQAVEVTKISDDTFRRYAKNLGYIPIKKGRKYYYPKEAVIKVKELLDEKYRDVERLLVFA
jgi:hypothetical protein